MVKTTALPIGPKDALCALFLLIRESGRPSLASFASHMGVPPLRLAQVIEGLRKQGLLADEGLSLTFLGLATAASLLPTSRITYDDGRLVMAA